MSNVSVLDTCHDVAVKSAMAELKKSPAIKFRSELDQKSCTLINKAELHPNFESSVLVAYKVHSGPTLKAQGTQFEEVPATPSQNNSIWFLAQLVAAV
jgi:hypothetical protein